MDPLTKLYYSLKPAIPRRLQICLRRQLARYKRRKYAHTWPIDPSSNQPPEGWTGWPNGKKFALLLCHDVDTKKGSDTCLNLAEIEENLGFRSYFNFVPEGYHNSTSVLKELRKRGFGIGIHGLNHDGKLFSSRKIFDQRAVKINDYLKKWNTRGFSSPSMHHNPDWMHAMNIAYSTSTFDTDPFEPQPDGVNTIFPFWVQKSHSTRGYIEIPSTMPQDHLLFVILREKNIDIWKKKLDWIAEHGGMALLNTHTDYMCFEGQKSWAESYPVGYYIEFLKYINRNYKDHYWHVLPNALAGFWKENLVRCNS